MSKLALLRTALRSGSVSRSSIRWAPATRYLSTEAESSNPPSDDAFLRSASDGLVFGRITNSTRNSLLGRNMLKTDVIHYLNGCDLSTDDVKFVYNRVFTPVSILLQFSSHSSYDSAIRTISKKGRLYRLEKIDRSEFDLKESYDGKSVLLQGVPRNCLPEDIERFLSGCNFDPEFKFFFKLVPGTENEYARVAIVRFPTQLDAMNAFCSKHRGYILNNPISMRILH